MVEGAGFTMTWEHHSLLVNQGHFMCGGPFFHQVSVSVWAAILNSNSMSFFLKQKTHIPGDSSSDLFGMVKTWPFKGLFVTSNDRG